MAESPLILTMMLDEEAQQYFTNLRTEHFPKHCNYLQAHLTLFHRLPANEPLIEKTLVEFAASCSEMQFEVNGFKNMGKGVAFTIEAPSLTGLHKVFQAVFTCFLTAQDRHKRWPHITVQNKVTAYKAKQTFELLQKDFQPFFIQGIAISTWLYRNGPWEKQANYYFL